MQITTNYSQNTTPNFTAFKMPHASQRRFMIGLRQQCNADELLLVRNIMETQKNNPTNIVLHDWGYLCGEKFNGHLFAKINRKEYWNTRYLIFPHNGMAKFFQKLADIAENGRPVKLSKAEIAEQKLKNIQELSEAKKYRKKGTVTEKEQRQYLLGEIYKMIK